LRREESPAADLPVPENADEKTHELSAKQRDAAERAEAAERRAAARLKSAKSLLAEKKIKEAGQWLKRIIAEEPETESAEEARELMRKTPGLPRP
jgi:hypothetical protein